METTRYQNREKQKYKVFEGRTYVRHNSFSDRDKARFIGEEKTLIKNREDYKITQSGGKYVLWLF